MIPAFTYYGALADINSVVVFQSVKVRMLQIQFLNNRDRKHNVDY